MFFVDLHKAERDYSPTTMYRDYAINRELFHWESQSRQTPRQPTVQRYINHQSRGTRILLFVRERKTFELGTQPFTFLGPADYVEHRWRTPCRVHLATTGADARGAVRKCTQRRSRIAGLLLVTRANRRHLTASIETTFGLRMGAATGVLHGATKINAMLGTRMSLGDIAQYSRR